MSILTLSSICQWVDGDLQGADASFDGVCIDSRTIAKGELFIPIIGPNFDGHHFIEQAQRAGAAAAIVSQPVNTTLPVIGVADTGVALAKLAAGYREHLTIPLVAVTGSCGKTTTRDYLAAILSQCGETVAAIKSQNNIIGVPLTIMRIKPHHQFAVAELGANHHHEIAELTAIAKPTIAVLTNAAPVHIEGFGDIDGVAKAKGEIFQGLTDGGTAVINADDHYYEFWKDLNSTHKIISFGIENKADVSARAVEIDSDGRAKFTLHTPSGDISIKLGLLGLHNVMNAIAAAAAVQALGVSLQDIKKGLESVTAVEMRLQKKQGMNGAMIIDDSYNANPTSLKAAMHVLVPNAGQTFLVIGQMGELGDNAIHYHTMAGEQAKSLGITKLYACGELAKYSVTAFGDNGYFFEDQQSLIKQLKSELSPDSTVLVKGSRSERMEKVVHALLSTGGVN